MDQLTIIVACFNEENTIESCLRALMAAARDAEILVIHGGTDKTLEIARAIAKDHPCIRTYKNFGDSGKGHAIKLGITVTDRPYILQFDADMQFDPADLPKVVQPLLGGSADVVIGSRFHPESDLTQYQSSFLRDIGNRIVNRWLSILAGQRISDVTTGYKGWTRAAIETIQFKDNAFIYEMEILMRATLARLRIVELPIGYRSRESGHSGHGSGVREYWSLCTCGLQVLWWALMIRLRLW